MLLRAGVREGRFIAADTAELEAERVGGDAQLVDDHLAAVAVVSRDDAGDGLLVGVGLADAHHDLAAGLEPARAGRVVDLYVRRLHAEQIGWLERPRELFRRRAAGRAGVDGG